MLRDREDVGVGKKEENREGMLRYSEAEGAHPVSDLLVSDLLCEAESRQVKIDLGL